MAKFKVGDRLITGPWFDGHCRPWLQTGGIVTVESVRHDMLHFAEDHANDMESGWLAHKFSLAPALTAKRVYISGPITGVQDHNFPAFNAAADRLTALGFAVFNPASHGSEGLWVDFMKRDIAELLKCDALVELPPVPGIFSKGAQLEFTIAEALGIPTWDLAEFLKIAEFING